MKTFPTGQVGPSAFTLVELLFTLGISAVMFGAAISAGVGSLRSLTTADDYSYESNAELRAMDFIARDLRRALTVNISNGGQTLNLTLPDYYTAYDADGNPNGNPVTPTIVNGAPVYANSALPISVSYSVSGGRVIRTQTIQRTGATSNLVICSNVNNFQLAFVSQSTTITYTITFDPKYQSVSSSLNAGTRIAGTVSVRAIRFQ